MIPSRIPHRSNTCTPPDLEITDAGSIPRRLGSLAVRRAEHRHRIQLLTNPDNAERGCWTLVVTGPHRRQWGFWCSGSRFVPWQAFGADGCATSPP